MDIAALSTSLSTMELSTKVGVAVMNIAKEQMEQSGAQMTQMMQQMGVSLDPNVGQNIDISI